MEVLEVSRPRRVPETLLALLCRYLDLFAWKIASLMIGYSLELSLERYSFEIDSETHFSNDDLRKLFLGCRFRGTFAI